MFIKKRIGLLLLLIVHTSLHAMEPYQNPVLTPDERSIDLIKRLTLEEKVSLMMNNSPAIPRLGILPIEWWNEALHGVARAGKATVFPQVIGMAASFDKDCVLRTYTAISDEARAKHHSAKNQNQYKRYQGLTFWTPNINIFRDPRWGRGMETFGEDPYLTTQLGLAVVEGLQGDSTQKYDKTHACAKHFAVHSGPESIRHSFDAKNISARDLWETYLPAFKSLVTEGKVREVMCAYNRFEGEPCCSSKELLINILRNDWKFNDIIVSDCGAIGDFFSPTKHNTHPSAEAASSDAVKSGTDLCCGSEYASLTEGVKQGLISEAQLDESLLRIFRARYQLGMMDPDSLVSWSSIPYSVVEGPEHVRLALEMAQKSMVLLKNARTLPLSKNKRIAVIGPNANDSVMLWGNYNGIPTHSATILDGIRSKVGADKVYYEPGCDLVDGRVYESVANHCSFEGKSGFNATYWNNPEMKGETVCQQMVLAPIQLDNGGNTVFAPGVNLTNFSARYETTFQSPIDGEVLLRVASDDGVRVRVNGSAFVDSWKKGSAKLEQMLTVEKNKRYDIVLDYFQLDKKANLKFNLDIVSNLDLKAIAERVKDYDAIVFAGGISSSLEGESMSVTYPGFKGGDRTTIELPAVQSDLLKELKKTGKPVVFVLCSGSTMALPWEKENLDAILAAWYPGQQGGQAVADVLFGDYNPAGRLPLTFFSATSDLPDFEDYNMAHGRTYRYFKGKPLYPFGYGLSYTTFDYSKASTGKTAYALDEPVQFRFDLKNTGKLAGDEVVQVYIRNLQDSTGPLKSLRHFERIHLAAGASKTVSIELKADAFEFFDPSSSTVKTLPGNYELLYGGSSDEKDLKKMTVRLMDR